MIITSKDFGELAIAEEEILHFPQGLFAFEEISDYVLLEREDCFVKWLQSVQDQDPRFMVCDPEEIMADYRPVIPAESLRELGIQEGESYQLYLIAVIPDEITEMTVNLKSPLVINPRNHLAAQIILEQEDYPVRQRVFLTEGGR